MISLEFSSAYFYLIPKIAIMLHYFNQSAKKARSYFPGHINFQILL
jgi:hypothetical protein